MDCLVLPSYRVGQALMMGTMSIANAIGFAPNFQKGIAAASHIFHLLDRKPQIYDPPQVSERNWVSILLNQLII
jgi:ATP-binding cassette subfamily B (MDR/TAP) protein 1